jgi:hypothetical protein
VSANQEAEEKDQKEDLQRIYLKPGTKQALEDMGRKKETFNDVIERLLKKQFDDVPEETRKTLEAILSAVDKPFTLMNVSQGLAKFGTKALAVLGYSGDKFFDMGVSTAQKANIITFFEDDDPTRTRMRVVIGSLQGLIKDNKVPSALICPHCGEKVSYLEAIVELFGTAALEG